MTVYTKSMMESLAEVRGLQEDNMALMRKAAGGAMQTIKMKDGKLKMDSFTASAIMKIFDKVNPANQKKMERMINQGTKGGMMKLQAFAMKQVKSGYGEETELDEVHKGSKGVRQLIDPKKEVMVVKKNKVVVIDKKDQDKYLKQGWSLAEETEIDEGFINIGGAKVKDDEKSILQHIKKTFPNVKKVRKDPQHGWIPVFEDGELDE